ncbi:ATP-dependent RNA helicase SrmB, partial [Proteus mirabilis]|nr:ATP-dependent RNA helicase SrmB [Proteus mirabilis]
VLIATDVASRGLDLEDITHVFNFDLPRTADVYLHRIGRTGRAGRKGTAISLVEAHDYPLLGKISRYIQEPIKYRVVAQLRPVTKAPSQKASFKPSKKVLAKRKAKKVEEKKNVKEKVRARDRKNIGKRRKTATDKTTITAEKTNHIKTEQQ